MTLVPVALQFVVWPWAASLTLTAQTAPPGTSPAVFHRAKATSVLPADTAVTSAPPSLASVPSISTSISVPLKVVAAITPAEPTTPTAFVTSAPVPPILIPTPRAPVASAPRAMNPSVEPAEVIAPWVALNVTAPVKEPPTI